MFPWFKRRRRRRILAQPPPGAWLDILPRRFHHWLTLNDAERRRLLDDARVFMAEKHWEGCGGLSITDEIRLTVAANACLLLLGREHDDFFPSVTTVLIYPASFRAPSMHGGNGDVDIVEENVPLIGEAIQRGPVILSWQDVRRVGGGHNVVLHEFAHQLDMEDGFIDGTPALADGQTYQQWARVMTEAFEQLRSASRRGRATLLDEYGATDEAEFFAVATECFFESSRAMRQWHPQLYAALAGYFNQDPASRQAIV